MNRAIQPKIEPLKSLNIPLPQRKKLKNGVPITLINMGNQQVIRVDVLFKAGTWCQKQKLQALFTNRMLREGSKKYSAKDIAEQLDYYGAWIDLSCGAAYSCVTLYSLTRYFKETLAILESIIKEPIFDADRLEIVKDMNIQQFLVNESHVDFMAHRTLLNMLLGDTHPYGKKTEKEDYIAINTELLNNFFEENFHSSNCHIFLAGDISQNVFDEVESAFGLVPFGNYENPPTVCPTPVFTPSVDSQRFIEKKGACQSAISLGMPTLMRNHPDFLKFQVVLALFGGYFGSRLVSNVREDKGYTYHISADMTHYPFSSFLLIHTECDNEYVRPLIEQVHYEMDRLHTELVDTKELGKLKNYMLGESCRSYESAFSIADAWMFAFTSGLEDDYFIRSFEAIQSITVEEVRELAQKYLRKESLKEVVAGEKLL